MAVVTSINISNVTDQIHVTVTDQNGNPLPPESITWTLPANSIVGQEVTGTNFLFFITPGQQLPQSSTSIVANATYNGTGNPNPVLGPDLTVNIIVPVVVPTVTALQYTSP